jgi:hypothetical protein
MELRVSKREDILFFNIVKIVKFINAKPRRRMF